jgi:VanZ family protein
MMSFRLPRFQFMLIAAVLVFILVGTLMPVELRKLVVRPFPRRLHVDLIGHALAFAAQAALMVKATRLRWPHVLLMAILLAIGTELAQSFIPGRTALASDVLVDVAAAAAGLLLATLASTRRRPAVNLG